MKKFEFRLEAALRLRQTQREIERSKLQGLLADESRLRNAVLALEAERQRASSALHSSQEIDAFELRALSAYNLGAEARKATLIQQLSRQNHLVAEARGRVIAAERNVTLLEKLREKQRAGWQAEWDREIEQNAQEAWTAVHGRRPLRDMPG